MQDQKQPFPFFLKEYFSYAYLKFGWISSGASAVFSSQAVDECCVVATDPKRTIPA